MALDYTGSPNGLFITLGKIAKHYFAQASDASDLITDRDEILAEFQAMNSGDPAMMVETFATDVEGWRDEHVARRTRLQELALTRLQDRVTVLDEIGAVTTEQAEILEKLIDRMVVDAESVDASTVTIGSVNAASGNTGNGTVLTTAVLDGNTAPGAGFVAQRRYKGLTTELCVPSETMTIRCTSDSFVDGATEGSESFVWEGRIADTLVEGSGLIGTITPVNGSNNLLEDGDLEDWTSNVPDSWDIVAGTAGTHISEETNASNVYHGASGLEFTGDGAVNPEIKQDMAGVVTAGKRYVVTCRIKASATIAAGTLTIQFEGTGYTAGGSEKITVAHGSLPTSWTLKSFFVNMPDSIPSDFKLVVRWGSTPENAKSLWIDDIALAAVNYGGGLGAVVVRGSTPFVRGDSFNFTVANNDAGAFQKFFRQAFGVQLPSDSGGSETIADTLTT